MQNHSVEKAFTDCNVEVALNDLKVTKKATELLTTPCTGQCNAKQYFFKRTRKFINRKIKQVFDEPTCSETNGKCPTGTEYPERNS